MTVVTGLTADRVRIPFRRPFVTTTGMWLQHDAWIIQVRAADGRVGVGEATLGPAPGEVADTVLAQLVREAAEGATEGRVPSAVDLDLHGTPGRALAAALASALLDLERPVGTTPVSNGDEAWVQVNATIGSMGPAAAAEAALQAVAAGFGTLKVKVGVERETEALVERVRAIRTAIGPEVALRLDANGAWDLPTAEDRLTAIERFAIEYIEQPLAALDIDGLAELRRRVQIPVAADEGVESVRAAGALLMADAVDVLVAKPARVGGPAAVAEIAALAAERGVPVVVSTLFETGVGIAAALAAAADLPDVTSGRLVGIPAHGLATAGLLEHDLLQVSLMVDGGWMRAPAGPGSLGLGIVLDQEALVRYRVETVGTRR